MTRRSGAIYKSQLQNDLVDLVRGVMIDRRIGYSTIAKLVPGTTRDMVRRALGRKEAKTIDVEFTMRILEALGYDLEVQVTPRKTSEQENEQFATYRKRLLVQRKVPNYAQDTVFPVRVLVGHTRTSRRTEPAVSVVKAGTKQRSAGKELDHSSALASPAD